MRDGRRPRPPWWKGTRGEWWVVGQGILLVAVALAPATWRWSTPSHTLWAALGASLVIAGLGLAIRAIIELGPNLSALPRPRRQGVLVQTGLYAQARHPIYGGLILAATGWALWRTSGLHLVLGGALAIYLHAKAVHEETLLRARFPEYGVYRARTKRLIPWIY